MHLVRDKKEHFQVYTKKVPSGFHIIVLLSYLLDAVESRVLYTIAHRELYC